MELEEKGMPVYDNIISEVRAITANKIAELQLEEEIKFPSIIQKIKENAGYGKSRRTFNLSDFGEHTKKLLEAEGFKVSLEKVEYDRNIAMLNSYRNSLGDKVWAVSWY